MNLKRLLKKAATVLLAMVMCVSIAVGIVGLLVNNTLKDSSTLAIRLVNTEYKITMYDAVYSALEKNMALVAITPEDISDVLTEEVIREALPDGAVYVLSTIFGEGSDEWEFENEALRERIETFLGDYAEAEGIEYEAGSADQVYDMICDTVTAEMKVVPQTYADKVSPVFAKVKQICGLWYIPVILYALCVAGVFGLGRRHMKNALYDAVLPSYFGTFTVFAASAILYSKDYLAKTVLSDEMLQLFLRRLYNTVLYDLRRFSGIMTLAFLAMGLLAVFAIALGKRKRRRHH